MSAPVARRAGAGGIGRALARYPELGLAVAIAAVVGLIYALEPSHAFFQPYSQQTLFHNIALFGVLSVGAAVVIIAGGIDLSVGSVVALSAVVAAKLMTEWLPGARPMVRPVPAPLGLVAAAIGLTLLMGLVIGLIHALLINQFRLPPFIATLATLAGLRSLATVLSQNRTINVPSPTFRVLGSDDRYTLPIFAAVALIMSVMMGATVLGRHLYALGGNETAARLSGLPTRRLKAVAYALSGLLAALAGVLFAGNTGQADGRMGASYELFAITAAVVGGCSLSGGVGSIRGTVLGLILIQIVIKGTGLVVTQIDPTQIEGLVLGTVVVLAVAFNQRFRGRG
jgi:ribose/xylose/arabinose/galactoside ABC-type transport system permease subunit